MAAALRGRRGAQRIAVDVSRELPQRGGGQTDPFIIAAIPGPDSLAVGPAERSHP